MDLVYTVGPDPHHNFEELRYSIRTMERYMKKLETIFIVGELPPFLKNVVHIPFSDKHKYNSARNIYEKTMAACQHAGLSDHFWASADDNFLLAPLSPKPYPYFKTGTLEGLIRNLGDTSLFKPYVESTYWALSDRYLPTNNFSVHIPIIYHKQIFIDILTSYDWEVYRKGYTIKSLYANSLRIPGKEMKDIKIHTSRTITAIARKLNGASYFSTTESSWNEPMKEYLQAICKRPSTREIE